MKNYTYGNLEEVIIQNKQKKKEKQICMKIVLTVTKI